MAVSFQKSRGKNKNPKNRGRINIRHQSKARIKLPLLYIKVEESMAILFKRETKIYLNTSACHTLFLVAIHNTVLILLKEIPVVVVRVKLKKLFILWRYAQ